MDGIQRRLKARLDDLEGMTFGVVPARILYGCKHNWHLMRHFLEPLVERSKSDHQAYDVLSELARRYLSAGEWKTLPESLQLWCVGVASGEIERQSGRHGGGHDAKRDGVRNLFICLAVAGYMEKGDTMEVAYSNVAQVVPSDERPGEMMTDAGIRTIWETKRDPSYEWCAS